MEQHRHAINENKKQPITSQELREMTGHWLPTVPLRGLLHYSICFLEWIVHCTLYRLDQVPDTIECFDHKEKLSTEILTVQVQSSTWPSAQTGDSSQQYPRLYCCN